VLTFLFCVRRVTRAYHTQRIAVHFRCAQPSKLRDMTMATTATEEPINLTKAASSLTTSEASQSVRPGPDEATWKLIRETYRKVKEDCLDDWDIALLKAFDAGTSAFHVPIEVRQSPGKGRGVFVTQLIPKGTAICEDQSGHFTTESQWREFLSLLPRDLAYDAVSWAYVEKYQGKSAVWLDLYEGSLMNHGSDNRSSMLSKLCASCFKKSKKEDLSEEANLEDLYHDGKWHMHASRDIQPDEELLCDYDNFHDYDHKLKWYDDTWEEYIGDDDSGIHDY